MDDGSNSVLPSERRADLPAWLLSVVLHATLLIAIGLLAPATARPAPGDPPRAVGIALVRDANSSKPEYFSGTAAGGGAGGGASGGGTVSGTAGAAPEIGTPDLSRLVTAGGIQLPTGGPAGSALSGRGMSTGVGGLLQGGTNPGGGQIGGKTGTQVFGARGEGNRFVYVFDRSSSMSGFNGRPLAAAKRELVRSLKDLASGNQFQIIFYNERQAVFNPLSPNPPTMLFATEENRQLADQYVRQIDAIGGTHHLEALELALRMRPEVIFFLTDAAEPELTARELAEVRRKNESAATINAIEFGPGPFQGGENFLMRLARQNQGQHVYVDVTTLPEDSGDDAH